MFSFQVIIAQMIPCVDCYCSRTCERSLPLVLALHVPRYFVRIPNTDPPLTASEFQVTQVQACLSFFFLLLKGRGGVKITLFLAGIRCREGGYDCIKKKSPLQYSRDRIYRDRSGPGSGTQYVELVPRSSPAWKPQSTDMRLLSF